MTYRLRSAVLAVSMAISGFMIGSTAQAAESIGAVDEQYGAASVARQGAEDSDLSVGNSVYLNDVIKTGDTGSVGIMFNDETNFAVGPNAELTLDEFAYNPNGNSSGLLSVAQGSFAFVSGNLAHSGEDALRVKTSTMTIGVRGTKVAGDQTTVVLFPNENGTVGVIMVSNKNDKKLLTKAYTAVRQLPNGMLEVIQLDQYEAEKLYLKAIKALRDKSRIELQQKNQTDGARKTHQNIPNNQDNQTSVIINNILHTDSFSSPQFAQ